MIIVDNASPDKGEGCKVVQSYADKDSRIKLIAATVNKGSSGARNEAMRNAKGQFLAFLDSDDIWHPEYLSTIIDMPHSQFYITINPKQNLFLFH